MTDLVSAAREVLSIEAAAIQRVAERLDDSFARAIDLIVQCRGRIVVTGMGKSGAVARKVASTFASTGTPALFLHPAEGLHGDLGMVAEGDVLVAISHSGRTEELINILPVIRKMSVPIISLTGSLDSLLAHESAVALDVSVEREACPLNLSPTASTTAALAVGDALAVVAMGKRHFGKEDFARFHPGGALGKDLTLTVGELMRTGERFASVPKGSVVLDALSAITKAQAGAAAVTDDDGRLLGLVTDGDLRRSLVQNRDVTRPLAEFMTTGPLTANPRQPASEMLRLMEERVVDDLPVVDDQGRAVGMLDVQDLLRAGVRGRET